MTRLSGSNASPDSSGVVAGHLLEVEDEEEEQRRQPPVQRERLDVTDREVPALEQVEAQHRVARAGLVDQERGEQEHTPDQGAAHRRVRPPQTRLLDQGEHRPAEPQHAEHRTDHVDPPPGLGGPRGGNRFQDQPQARDHQRHVDHEDPPPRRHVENDPSDERTRAPRRSFPTPSTSRSPGRAPAPGTSRRSPPANSASAARRRPLGARGTRRATRSSARPRTAGNTRRTRPPRARTPVAHRRCHRATRRAGSANRASAGTRC